MAADTGEQLGWLLEGFQRALTRYEGLAYDVHAPPRETYIPLFEALEWCDALADWIKRDHGYEGKPERLRAIEYVRNAVHHQFVDALKLLPRGYGEGTYGEATYGGQVWKWKRLDEWSIPAPSDKFGRAELYSQHLAGRSVLDTLRAIKEDLRPFHTVDTN